MTYENIPYSYNELLVLTQPRVIHCLDEYHRQVHWIDRIMKVERLSPKYETRIRIVELLASNVLHYENDVSGPLPTISAHQMLVHTMANRQILMDDLAGVLDVPCQLIEDIFMNELAISLDMARKLAKFFDHPIECYVDSPSSSSSVHTPDDVADPAGSTDPLDS